ncbi:MAG: sugar-binding domain-containing protein [Eisenbergiella massiliensis]
MREERIWRRPQIVPMPLQTGEISEPQICLNGTGWKLCSEPGEEFWNREASGTVWEDTQVPMQRTPSEREYAYAFELEIPEAWKEHRIFLRFDGVNCRTRVFVDGRPAGEHYGGFVSWDCEITEEAACGGRHWLVLWVTDDPAESVRSISGYHRM